MTRAALIPLLLLPACKLDFQRMLSQRRTNQSSDDPARIALMRSNSPPSGAVAHLAAKDQVQANDGCDGHRYVESAPVTPSTDLMAQGRTQFDRVCAACHGRRGDGDSPVAQAMERTKPPSLLLPPVRDYPAGRTYRTVMFGYKLMPSYRDAMTVRDGWAVTEYLRSMVGTHAGGALGSVAAAPSPGPVCPGEEP